MKITDMLIEELNKNLTEEQKANGEKFERLNNKPVEIVETPTGTKHRDIKTGRFTKK